MKDKKLPLYKKIIFISAGVLLVVAVWGLLSLKINSEVLLPAPHAVLIRLISLLGEKETYKCVLSSLVRITLGIASGTVLGLIFAVLSVPRELELVLSPLERVIRATPVASFIILALVWMPSETISVLISALIVMPVVARATLTAIRQTSPALLETAKAYNIGRLKTVRAIIFPSVLPHFLSALSTSIGIGWKAGIAAEVLCAPKGTIGRMLYNSKIYLETTDLFCWTVVVILLSLLTEWGVSALKRGGSRV